MDSELIAVSTKPVARRRVHSAEFKAMIVARCERGDESLASIALAHQLNATMVRKWVRDHQRGALGAGKASFVPVTVAEGLTTPGGVIEITLECPQALGQK